MEMVTKKKICRPSRRMLNFFLSWYAYHFLLYCWGIISYNTELYLVFLMYRKRNSWPEIFCCTVFQNHQKSLLTFTTYQKSVCNRFFCDFSLFLTVKLKWDFFGNFQTLCKCFGSPQYSFNAVLWWIKSFLTPRQKQSPIFVQRESSFLDTLFPLKKVASPKIGLEKNVRDFFDSR